MELKDEMLLFRAKRNLSQRQLAEMARVSSQTVNSIENGTQTPTKLTETKIRLVIDKE